MGYANIETYVVYKPSLRLEYSDFEICSFYKAHIFCEFISETKQQNSKQLNFVKN